MKKKILLGVLAAVVVIQFIRPDKNQASAAESPNDIGKHYQVPSEVAAVLKTACYDCHSNNTRYPWYFGLQPVAWVMQHHVNDGKKHLNFSEFGGYAPEKAKHKFEEIADEVLEGEMPLTSYRLLHSEAKLTEEQKKLVAAWASELKK